MIDNDVVSLAAKAVLFFSRLIPWAESNITYDQVLYIKVYLEIFDANAITWRGLPGNGQIRMNDFKFRFERNRSRDSKNYSARPVSFARGAKTAWPAILQIGHLNDS